MIAYRILRLTVHLFSGLFTSAFVFPFCTAAERERLIKNWSVKLIRLCGVQIQLHHNTAGVPVRTGLVVANHISWLDIFVINSIQPCRFVAKSDIRDWPLIGWLCEKVGTIFIARGRRRDVRRIYRGLVDSIRAGEHIAFFPEGTTASQGEVLPFHANLFEAAIESQVPIQPVALRYVDAQGRFHPAVDFVGDTTFAQSMIMVLKSKNIRAELIILPMIETGGVHRRDLAQQAHHSIATALGYAEPNACPAPDSEDNLPETPHGPRSVLR